MKINELRVNNWYKSVKFGIPVQCELVDLYELCAWADGAYDHPPIEEMFEPIPLTEEWLERFGFYGKYKSVHTQWTLNGLSIEQESNVDEDNNTIPTEQRFHYNWDFTVDYVHELQNLYFTHKKGELEVKPLNK